MCIIANTGDSLVVVGLSTMAPVVPVTSASSAGLVQIMKPKLPRKITRTAKINLNRYWSMFENMMVPEGGSPSSNSNAVNNEFVDTSMNNEINENISNEQREIDNILVRRNNERNSAASQRCTCHFCLISDLRNVTVSERNEEVTEL
ncbi:UNVERIFIED_CONTAM: hypothetical protein PYX00_003147 [Menopon gallinae]|uniref:Uncharacterized protein n=1 Tax=Menopon gallinae TaxID=328185 RepID=A0AAW2HZ15_9NEOP